MLTSIPSRFAANVLLFNASPRINNNTVKLLKEVKRGVEFVGKTAEIVHLSKIKHMPCQSCLACKRFDSPNKCIIKDQLSKYLDQLHEVDAFAIASPIYFGNFATNYYSFVERAFYSNYTYSKKGLNKFGRKIKTGILASMHCDEELAKKLYTNFLNSQRSTFERIFGSCTLITSNNQLITPKANIDYDMTFFDIEKMKENLKKQDPIVLKQCFDLGVNLASE